MVLSTALVDSTPLEKFASSLVSLDSLPGSGARTKGLGGSLLIITSKAFKISRINCIDGRLIGFPSNDRSMSNLTSFGQFEISFGRSGS